MKTIMMQFLDELKKDGYNIPLEHYNSMLEIEKEQIKKAYKDHHDLGHIFGLDTEQYFNQNYNN